MNNDFRERANALRLLAGVWSDMVQDVLSIRPAVFDDKVGEEVWVTLPSYQTAISMDEPLQFGSRHLVILSLPAMQPPEDLASTWKEHLCESFRAARSRSGPVFLAIFSGLEFDCLVAPVTSTAETAKVLAADARAELSSLLAALHDELPSWAGLVEPLWADADPSFGADTHIVLRRDHYRDGLKPTYFVPFRGPKEPS